MSDKLFKDRVSLKKWLASTAGVVLTSITFISDVEKLEFEFKSPKLLLEVMESVPECLPDGEYVISFTNSDDLDQDDLDYSKMVMVVSFEARLARHNIVVGGLTKLLAELSDFEYSSVIDRSHTGYTIASIWVLEPDHPQELVKLQNILESYATMYAFNDGTGFVTLNNGRVGKGSTQLKKG